MQREGGDTFATVDSAQSFWPEGRQDTRYDKPRRPPPQLGEHTLEVLAELGYSHEAIERLCRSETVAYLAAG